ncbi:MAG: glycosyltransferase family 2 protein [Bacteroidota bacterium]
MNSLVSVVIPAYNASGFIVKTMQSILNQSYSDIELIIVNDGSTDNTLNAIQSINDSRIRIFSRDNHGVSLSRNFGLQHALGKYIVFFDADDIMLPDFIQLRVRFLEKNPFFSFATSWVQKINEEDRLIGALLKSACNDMQNEILLYHSDVITCPSSYLFNKEDLITSNLLFDSALSSAADRYFLLQADKYLKGHFLRMEEAALYYRIRNESMSNKLTSLLIKDNELFYKYVIHNIKPGYRIRKLFLSKSNYILFGAYFKIGNYLLSFKYALISFFMDPINFVKTFVKKNLDIYYFQ